MKNRQLTINFIANFVAFAVNMVLAFFITPYLVNKVGSEAYEFIPLANNMANYVTILTTALNTVASRFISIEINSGGNERANVYFNSILRVNTIIALILIVPSILVTLYINKILNVPGDILADVQLTFGFVFINMIIALLGNVFSAATFCKNRLELYSFRMMEGNLIKLIITLLLFFLLIPKIYFITLTAIFATLYTLFINIHYTKTLLPEVKINPRIFSGKAIKELMVSGMWNVVNQLSVVLLTSLDLMIANILLGSAPTGPYALAKTIPMFLVSFIGTIVYVFMPQFTILYAKNDVKELLRSINSSIKVVGLITLIPISFLIVFGDTFFSLWVPGEDAGLLFLLSNLTIIPMIVTGSIEPLFNVFTVTNKLKVPAAVLLVTAIINTSAVIIMLKTTSLGIIVIPLVSLVIGSLRNLIFTPLYAAHCLNVKWWSFYMPILKGIACSVVMIVISYACKVLLPVNSWFAFIGAALLCGAVGLAINAFIMFDRKGIRDVISTFKKKK